ncbi:MAG: serine/threonine-protein kinase [Planctomycetota bacterium]
MNSEHWRQVEAFRVRFWGDVQAGVFRSRDDYLVDFPDLAGEIAAEFENLDSALSSRPSLDAASTQALPPRSGANVGGDPLAVDTRIRHYRLRQELGRGGQGIVYLADDERHDRRVAVKMLAYGQALWADARRRFEAEARAAGQLNIDGVARIHDSGEHQGVPYIVMEFVEGRTLADLIRARRHEEKNGAAPKSIFVNLDSAHDDVTERGDPENATLHEGEAESIDGPDRGESSSGMHSSGRQALRAVAEFIESAARAIHVAHEAGFVHRDLKPGNIMVRPNGRACVLDFGLAQGLSGPDGPSSGVIAGTIPYMAPEQTTGDEGAIGRATDVWGLGVILYETCTLTRPFRAATRNDVIRLIREADPTSPRDLNPDIDRDLEAIILTALEKDPARRYATAEELAEDLRRFREREPIQARPAGWALRTLRWAQRKPAVASLLLVVFLSLAATAILTTVKNRDLAASNLRLREKTEEERRARHATLLREAELQMNQGRYEAALATWGEAHRIGITPEAEYRVQQARARIGLLDYAGARDIVSGLDPHVVPAGLGARIQLLRANLLPPDQGGRGPAGVEESLVGGLLPPADRAFASALLAETVPAALARTREALEADPGHVLARELRGLLLFLMGDAGALERHAEVHRLNYPGDVRGHVFELLACVVRDDPDEKERREALHRELREALDEESLRGVLDLVTVMESLRTAERLFTLAVFANRNVATAAAFAYMGRQRTTADAIERVGRPGWRALGVGTLTWKNDFSSMAKLAAQARTASPEQMEEILAGLRASHVRTTNPVFPMLEGALAISRRRPDDAIAAARRLLAGPLNDSRATLAHGLLALGIYVKLGTNAPADAETLRALEQEWIDHAHWLVDYEDISPDQLDLWAEASAARGEEVLARRFAKALLVRFPDDWRGPLREAALLAEYGAKGRAIGILEDLSTREAARKSQQKVQEEARRRLEQLHGETKPGSKAADADPGGGTESGSDGDS